MRVVFVLGTEARVGKTAFAVALIERLRALGLSPSAIKPIETGCARAENHDLLAADGTRFANAVGRRMPSLVTSPYRFATLASAVTAADEVGLQLELADLVSTVETAARFGDPVIVEGPGGTFSPLTGRHLTVDLAARLSARVVIVARSASDARAAVDACVARGLEVAGVLPSAVDPEAFTDDDAKELAAATGVTVFPRAPFAEPQTRDAALLQHLTVHGVARAVLDGLADT